MQATLAGNTDVQLLPGRTVPEPIEANGQQLLRTCCSDAVGVVRLGQVHHIAHHILNPQLCSVGSRMQEGCALQDAGTAASRLWLLEIAATATSGRLCRCAHMQAAAQRAVPAYCPAATHRPCTSRKKVYRSACGNGRLREACG